MSRTVTRVRVRDRFVQPNYEATHGQVEARILQTPRRYPGWLTGEMLVIELPPCTPDTHWHCGVERVWRVPDAEVERIAGVSVPPGWAGVFVCEHQVEID